MAKLHFLKSVTDTINTSFILESEDTLLVVDGGFPSETPYLYEYLKSLGGRVSGWFLTHFHDDHFGAFLTMLTEHPDITVDKVYFNFPSVEYLIKDGPNQTTKTTAELYDEVRDAIAGRGIPTVIAQRGDVYEFNGGKAVVRVLRTHDESIPRNVINNSSSVFRFEADGKSILFLGDLGVEGGDQLVEITPPELLHADFVQMSHHGQGGVSRECYEAIRPTYTLWPTPSWLWENRGPGGYDTGHFVTVVTRGWISSLRCVKRHYLMIDGTQVINLEEA
jgi:beta-lactamase superfamily II metal-dependent hydrolase